MDRQTYTQDNYSNPRCACAPRVNKALHTPFLHLFFIIDLTYLVHPRVSQMLYLRKQPNLLGSSQTVSDVAILRNKDVGMGFVSFLFRDLPSLHPRSF